MRSCIVNCKRMNKNSSVLNFPASLIVPQYGELVWSLDKDTAYLLCCYSRVLTRTQENNWMIFFIFGYPYYKLKYISHVTRKSKRTDQA